MADPTHDAVTIPVVAILGIDAMLAARPATPVQLAHACLAAGYTEVYPASWGDELIAARSLEIVRARGREPAILCACPFVAERLLKVGDDLAPFIVSFVSPPVAAALYLRANYGEDGVHITYIGACPSGADPAIDLQLTPDDLLSALRDRGIDLSQQPRVFNSIIPPDRRRYYSIPGGAPSSEWLEREGDGRRLTVLDGEDPVAELAQHLISDGSVFVDPAPCMGCVCSGASASASVAAMRQMVATIEPPHATSSVVDTSIALDLSLESPYALVRADEPGEEYVAEHGEEQREAGATEAGEQYVEVDIASPDARFGIVDAQLDIVVEITEAQVEIRKEEGVADLGDLRQHEMVPWDEDLPSWNGDPVARADQVGDAEQEPADVAEEPAPVTTADTADTAEEEYAPAADETVEAGERLEPPPLSENGQRHTPRPRRVTPASVRRFAVHTPVVRTEEGRTLPRAYVVQRRTVASETGATEIVEESVVATSVAEAEETAERELPIDTSIEPAAAPEAPAPEAAAPEAPAPEAAMQETAIPEAVDAEAAAEAPREADTVAEAPAVEEPPVARTTSQSFRSVVVPIPSDRPRPVPPPPLKDRSPLAWALLGIAAIALSVVVIRLLGAGRESQRAESDTAAAAAQPVAPVTGAADSVTVSSDSASISPSAISPDTSLPDTGAVLDSAARDSVARDVAAARDSAARATPGAVRDTSAGDSDSAAAQAAPRQPPGATRARMTGPRRVVAPRQASPLTPDQRRRRFDSLARIVDSLVPVPAPAPPPLRPPR